MPSDRETSRWLEAGGLHGRLVVPADRPASLVVCIHGGGCNGRYFDLRSFSFTQAAIEAGHAVLLVDRPGHGASPAGESPEPVRDAARLLSDLVDQAQTLTGGEILPVGLFGHSIGGAVAMHWAAQSPPMLACLTTSGIGAQPTPAAMAWHSGLARADGIALPHAFFFGPDGSFDWRAPIAIRQSAEPWRKDDVDEVLLRWPHQFADVASRIACPTLCLLSEHERIWATGDAELEDMRRCFAAGRVRVEIAAGGGHLYEIHRNWSAHAERIIAFIEGHIG